MLSRGKYRQDHWPQPKGPAYTKYLPTERLGPRKRYVNRFFSFSRNSSCKPFCLHYNSMGTAFAQSLSARIGIQTNAFLYDIILHIGLLFSEHGNPYTLFPVSYP